MLDSSLHSGSPLDRYVVLGYLAEGGMGAIYLGKKMGAGGFEREVVLKQLLPEFTSQPEFIDLFLREARLSATLDHANIVRTIDLVTAGNEYFIVMEYVEGGDLRTLLKKAKRLRGRFSAAAGMFITREVLAALSYAHTQNGPDGRPLRLIHRDVSPSNILISRSGEVKLTDFGIAKASTHNSVFYRVKGKVGYMSPEQARSEELDSRSDLYSLAVCLYETITAERLFVHVGLTTSADEIYSQPVPRLSQKIRGLPRELDEVMFKALALDPRDRYQTAGSFHEALARCAHRHGLMMSAPELSAHLAEVCGDPDMWRESDDSPDVAERDPGGGTELYDAFEGTEQINASEFEDRSDLISVVHEGDMFDAAMFSDRNKRERRALTSMTNLGRLQTVELTSMIKLPELNDDGSEGSVPLVDLDFDAPPPRYDDHDLGSDDAGDARPTMEFASMRRPPPGPARTPPGAARTPTGAARTPMPAPMSSQPPGLRQGMAPGIIPFDPLAGFDVYEDSVDGGRQMPMPGPPMAGRGPGPPAGKSEADLFAELQRPRRMRRPWLLLLFILLLGIAAAMAVGLSGPQISGSEEPAPPSSATTP